MCVPRLYGSLLGALVLAVPPSLAAQTDPNAPPPSIPTSPNTNQTSPNNQTTPGINHPSGMAQDASINGAGNSDAQGMKDKIFLRKAAQGGLTEVMLGQLALQKASGEDVKRFAQRMVDDHTKLNDALKPFQQSMGVPIPRRLSKPDQAEYDKLNGLSGADFDKEYLTYLSADHHKDLMDFQEEDANATDPELKALVETGEHVIARHTRMVDRLATANGVTPAH